VTTFEPIAASATEAIPQTTIAPLGTLSLSRVRWRVRAVPIVWKFFIALMIAYLGKEAINSVLFPPFTGHDEVAHYSYLRTVATEHRIPELGKDRLPNSLYRYCWYTLAWRPCYPDNEEYRANPPQVAIYDDGNVYPVGVQYAANHPPLYYFLLTPAYLLTENQSPASQVYFLRALTIPFGALTVLFAFLAVRLIFPNDRFLSITVPAFVAWQPQVSYEAAMLNNDIVCIAFYSLILYELVFGIRHSFSRRLSAAIGVSLGLALLSKSTATTALPIIAVAMIVSFGWRNYRLWLGRGIITAGLASLVSAPWYIYLYRTYGNFSGLPQLKELQSGWNESGGSFFNLLFNADFVATRWQETWGEFGWRLIHINNTVLWIILIPFVVAVIGCFKYLRRAVINRELARGECVNGSVFELAPWQAWAVGLMAITFGVAYLAIVQFGTEFSLTQARYYFPAINALALLLMLGFRTLIPDRWLGIGQASIVSALILLNLVIYTVYVIPFWHLPA
jgi:4-amino-4-deoxy-L-arabinose transferase-like glycosyltransferase